MKVLKLILSLVLLISCAKPASTQISRRQLNSNNQSFLAKVIEENKDFEKLIRTCLNGTVGGGNPGIRLIDKLGFFTFDLKNRGVCVNKIKFFYRNDIFHLFIVFEDDYDGQLYTLYLEYFYGKKKKQCILKDVYFSLVFDEKMKDVRRFFQYR